jgi:hypothetical protein
MLLQCEGSTLNVLHDEQGLHALCSNLRRNNRRQHAELYSVVLALYKTQCSGGDTKHNMQAALMLYTNAQSKRLVNS